MGSLSIWHWLIVLAVVLILFGGRGKISSFFTDLAKGIKSFKRGLAEDNHELVSGKDTKVNQDKTPKDKD